MTQDRSLHSRLAARLASDLTAHARGDRITKGLSRLPPEVWTVTERRLEHLFTAFLEALSEPTCRDELFPELTRAVAALNAAEDALETAREKRRSSSDLAEFAAKENDAYREKARARRALFIIARLCAPKGDGT